MQSKCRLVLESCGPVPLLFAQEMFQGTDPGESNFRQVYPFWQMAPFPFGFAWSSWEGDAHCRGKK